MTLTQHLPSHLVIAEQRVLLSYDGQPTTCYGCGDTGHIYPKCPRRQRGATLPPSTTPVTYATIAATMPQSSGDQPRHNIHNGNSQLLDHAVDSNDKNMDVSSHGLEHCNSPMDSTQDAEMGDHHTPNHTAQKHQMEHPIIRLQRSPTTQRKRMTPANKSQEQTPENCQVRETI